MPSTRTQKDRHAAASSSGADGRGKSGSAESRESLLRPPDVSDEKRSSKDLGTEKASLTRCDPAVPDDFDVSRGTRGDTALAPPLATGGMDASKNSTTSTTKSSTSTPNPVPRRLPARPLLAGITVVRPPEQTEEELDAGTESMVPPTRSPRQEEGERVTLKRGKTKKKTQKSVRADEETAPSFSFTFRFLNYNMANRADLSMDDVGSGFLDLRERSSAPVPTVDGSSPGDPPVRPAPSSECLPQVGLSQLLTCGVQRPSKESIVMTAAQPTPTDTAPKLKVRKKTFLESCFSSSAVFRKSSKKKTAASQQVFSPPSRNETPAMVHSLAPPSVDCVFGVLCETKFGLEEYARALDFQGLRSTSALNCLTQLGQIEAMKGKVAQKVSGDLKSFTVTRSTFEENEDGKVFCSYDDASQGVSKGNPMKSFIGHSFEAACGAVRFVFLGTHFPMQKVSSLMEDTTRSEGELLQKMKCLVARLLRKILSHLVQKALLDLRTMVILQGDLNSRCIRHEGKYVDLLWETLQDSRLQSFICMDLPIDLRGEWREVISCSDPAELPATYRFNQTSAPQTNASVLRLSEVFGKSPEDAPASYREVLEGLRAKSTMQDWGLYNPKTGPAEAQDDKAKFKPSRLPACTERVLYYAPEGMLETCHWETARGYEVNYLQTGSDHKPVLLEATLTIKEPCAHGARTPKYEVRNSPRFAAGSGRRGSQVPDDFEERFLVENADDFSSEEDSDDSMASQERLRKNKTFMNRIATGVSTVGRNITVPRARTAVRLSVQGDMDIAAK